MQMLKPIYDRIIVKPLAKEEKTSGGLFIPGVAQEIQPCGTVLITGPGRREPNGNIKPMTIKNGDVVYYAATDGLPVSHDGHECLIMNEADVIAIRD